jgi:hypothetical protein
MLLLIKSCNKRGNIFTSNMSFRMSSDDTVTCVLWQKLTWPMARWANKLPSSNQSTVDSGYLDFDGIMEKIRVNRTSTQEELRKYRKCSLFNDERLGPSLVWSAFMCPAIPCTIKNYWFIISAAWVGMHQWYEKYTTEAFYLLNFLSEINFD